MTDSTQPVPPGDPVCPFAGLANDPATAMAYPSPQNYCHRATPPASPVSSHQRRFCLAAAHIRCELFTSDRPRPMPASFLGEVTHRTPFRLTRWWRWLVALLILALLAGLAAAGLLITSDPAFARLLQAAGAPPLPLAASLTPRPTLTLTATRLPTATPRPTLALPPTSPPPTLTLPPTSTATPPAPHLLETPIGQARQFVVHHVASGESLATLSRTYHTSVDAIRAVNASLGIMILANSDLILPVGQTSVSGLAPMTPYLVPAGGLALQALAAQQGVDAASLAALNDRPTSYTFQAGEWALIPQPSPSPTAPR